MIVDEKANLTTEAIFEDSDMKTGIGLQTTDNNTQIFSSITDSKFQGKSMQIKKNEIFIGEVINGTWTGECKILNQNADRTTYTKIKNGKFFGDSIIQTKGKIIKGDITSNGNEITDGCIEYQDGRFFEGKIKNFNPFQGVLKNGENYLYEGNFRKTGLPEGEGELRIGDILYQGNFKNGNLEGKIEYKNNKTGESFKGIYQKNKANGFGELEIPKKKLSYKGDFKNGKFEGEGYLLEDKTEYKGHFEEGNFTGVGEIHIGETDQIYKGKFFKGELWGHGEYISGKGFVYRGEFEKGIFQGEGEIYYEDNNYVFQGNFINGKREGVGVIYDEKGDVVTQG